MIDIIRDWYSRNFSDPQAVILALLLVVVFGLVWLFGDILAPVLVALVLAYLLEGVVKTMQRWRVPRTLASAFVLLAFVAVSLVVLFVLVPLLFQQVEQLVRAIPNILARMQEQLLRLPELYPEVFTVQQVNDLTNTLRRELGSATQDVLSFSIAQIGSIVVIAVYAVLVPLMVFFGLKDKDKLLAFFARFIPKKSELSFRVWREVDGKIANYIRGKFVEIVIVWGVTYVDVPADGARLLAAAVVPGRRVGHRALHRRGARDGADRADRLLPVGPRRQARLPAAGLPGHPDPRRQRAGAAAVLRGREPAPARDHRRGAVLRRPVRLLGRVLRDPARHAVPGGHERVAERARARAARTARASSRATRRGAARPERRPDGPKENRSANPP